MAKNKPLDSFNGFTFNNDNETEQTPVQERVETSEVEKESGNDEVVKIPQKEETRSKRINLLLQPSVHKMAQKKCKKMGISLNECINQLLKNWVED